MTGEAKGVGKKVGCERVGVLIPAVEADVGAASACNPRHAAGRLRRPTADAYRRGGMRV